MHKVSGCIGTMINNVSLSTNCFLQFSFFLNSTSNGHYKCETNFEACTQLGCNCISVILKDILPDLRNTIRFSFWQLTWFTALCIPYALFMMHYAWHFAVCIMHYALPMKQYVSHIMHYSLLITHFVFCIVHKCLGLISR